MAHGHHWVIAEKRNVLVAVFSAAPKTVSQQFVRAKTGPIKPHDTKETSQWKVGKWKLRTRQDALAVGRAG